MNHPLKELVEQCEVTSVKPISNDDGEIKKIIIEYEPHKDAGSVKIPSFVNNGGH